MIFIVIPAKDEAPRVGGVLDEIQALGYENVVVVNDGSADQTAQIAAQYPNVTVLNHVINLGAGAATQTGIEYALKKGAEIVVTLDADHQHQPEDIRRLVRTLQEEAVEVALGSRFLHTGNKIPFLRLMYNKVGNFITFLFSGVWVTDSQSGMKAFSATFLERSKIASNGYEFCSEIIRNIGQLRASWCEVPIQVIYTKETQQKGQSFVSGLRMLARMLRGMR